MESENSLGIEIEGRKIKIKLLKDGNIVSDESWEDEGNLSQTLLKKMDELLKRNNLTVQDLKSGVNVKSDNESYTSARIAKITADMINFSLEK